jgi:hypothetical protein
MSQALNNLKLGDISLNKPYDPVQQFPKKFNTTPGSTTFDIPVGFLCAYDPADSPTFTRFIIAPATAVKPFFFAKGHNLRVRSGVSYPTGDNDYDLFAALTRDEKVGGFYKGEIVAAIDGVVYPGRAVMPSNTSGGNILGHVKAWDGVSRDTIVGYYQGLIGQRHGKYIMTPTPAAVGTLGWVNKVL